MLFASRRLKYIEAELAKRRGAAGGGEAAAAPVEGWAAAEAALYETPAELRQDSPGRGAADTEGADRWLTGITEVQLPVEYKLKVRYEKRERSVALFVVRSPVFACSPRCLILISRARPEH